ncbi:MAG: DegT/DnrJ/EryC1/StrS family aminotransferase [Pseudomonadota bacterium]
MEREGFTESMAEKKIPITRVEFTDEELDSVRKALTSGQVAQGPFVEEFERKWRAFNGSRHAIATSSCTSALHLSLAALGVGPGDEVILPAFTWVATANCVEILGAKPVFCDIDLRTFNIDVSLIEGLITESTKAVIPVHLFGLPADMKPVMAAAAGRDLIVVEDAACGFGARYGGASVGNFGRAGCFSFHPRKAITTGEGGMIVTADDALAQKLRSLRDHGAVMSKEQQRSGPKPWLMPDFPRVGFNFRLTDIQAAIGSAQMDRAVRILERRAELAARYDEALKGVEWLALPHCPQSRSHGYQSYVCLMRPEAITARNVVRLKGMRNALMDFLQKKGIATRPGTHAVHLLGYYAEKYDLTPQGFEQAWFADSCSVALPLFASLRDDELDYIVSTIKSYSQRMQA